MNDFTPGLAKNVAAHTKDPLKARNEVAKAKKDSGWHEPDTWKCINTKRCTVHKGVIMPDKPVHCPNEFCEEFLEIAAAHVSMLAKHLKSSSTQNPDDSEPKKVKKDVFVAVIQTATANMETTQKKVSAQRKKLMEF